MADNEEKPLPKMVGFHIPTSEEERVFASFDQLRRIHPEVKRVIEAIAEELEEET